MFAGITGPLSFSFFVRPKLPPGENWTVLLKARGCGADKEWVVVKRTTTRTRQELVSPRGTIAKLVQHDGWFTGVRAYKLITPEQRGFARTMQRFRNYPLNDGGLLRIGVC